MLSLEKISLALGDRDLLDEVTVLINPGENYHGDPGKRFWLYCTLQ